MIQKILGALRVWNCQTIQTCRLIQHLGHLIQSDEKISSHNNISPLQELELELQLICVVKFQESCQ